MLMTKKTDFSARGVKTNSVHSSQVSAISDLADWAKWVFGPNRHFQNNHDRASNSDDRINPTLARFGRKMQNGWPWQVLSIFEDFVTFVNFAFWAEWDKSTISAGLATFANLEVSAKSGRNPTSGTGSYCDWRNRLKTAISGSGEHLETGGLQGRNLGRFGLEAGLIITKF